MFAGVYNVLIKAQRKSRGQMMESRARLGRQGYLRAAHIKSYEFPLLLKYRVNTA